MTRTLKNLCLVAATCTLALATPANAIFGAGLHYGLDYSLSMPDKIGAQVPFDDLSLNTTTGFGNVPSSFRAAVFQAADLPIYISTVPICNVHG